jgi:hypothetical protein
VTRGRWRHALAGTAFTLAVACAPLARADAQAGPRADEPWEIEVAPGAQVIVDDYLRGATPADAAEGLRFCEAVPGCRALWQPDVGTIVILRPVAVDGAPPPITQPTE